MNGQISLTTLSHVPLIHPGDDLVTIILQALEKGGQSFQSGDILVIASKIVSKAEGRFVRLAQVTPSDEAVAVAERCHKDPRLVHLILEESEAISRLRPNLLIMRHRLGFVCANAGLDASNVSPESDTVLLLPADPDVSAASIRQGIVAATGLDPAVVIVDSHGRPHRMGAVGVAIGASGLPALQDWRGQPDLFGRPLAHTTVGLGDQIASAASLLFGQAAEGTPVVLMRGLVYNPGDGSAVDLVRPRDLDMYD